VITRVTVIAPATAPIIGGILVTGLSWHWIFLINVPIALGALLFGLACLPRAAPTDPKPFDWRGFVLAGGGLAALLYAVGAGPTDGWADPATWAPGLAGAAALAAFARYSLRRPAPVLRLSLLRDRMFRVSCVLTGCSTTAFFGSLVFTALYLQEGRGASALGVALLSVILVSGTHGQVRAPVSAFHAVYLTSAGLALIGVLLALTIRDNDAWSTMNRQPGENRDPAASVTPLDI
jgi:MFS family permease